VPAAVEDKTEDADRSISTPLAQVQAATVLQIIGPITRWFFNPCSP